MCAGCFLVCSQTISPSFSSSELHSGELHFPDFVNWLQVDRRAEGGVCYGWVSALPSLAVPPTGQRQPLWCRLVAGQLGQLSLGALEPGLLEDDSSPSLPLSRGFLSLLISLTHFIPCLALHVFYYPCNIFPDLSRLSN